MLVVSAGLALLWALVAVSPWPAAATTPASGIPTGRLAAIVNQPAWAADLDPTVGTSAQPIAVFTPAPCPAGTTRHKTSVVKVKAARAADQPEADRWPSWGNLYSPVAAELPGPLVAYPAAMNWASMASLHGLTIVPGTYDLVTRCQDNLGQRIFAQWTGQVVFDSATRYHVPAPYATSEGRTAMATQGLPGAAGTTPAPAPSASASGSGPAASTPASSPPATPGEAGPSPDPSALAAASAVDASDAAAVGSGGAAGSWALTVAALLVVAMLVAGGVLVVARRGRTP